MRAISSGLLPFKFEEYDANLPIRPSVLRSTWDWAPSQRPTAKEFVVALRTGLGPGLGTSPRIQNR
jgi:hypothetical protein